MMGGNDIDQWLDDLECVEGGVGNKLYDAGLVTDLIMEFVTVWSQGSMV